MRAAAWDWIPVADRLPNEDVQVLAVTKHGHLHVAYRQDTKWKIRDLPIGACLSSSCVTHWCTPNLPTP